MTRDWGAPEHSFQRKLAPESPHGYLLFGVLVKVVIRFFLVFWDFVLHYQKPWNLLKVGIWKAALWFWMRALIWGWKPR